jgi:succinoglycan biosynthesis transport protein ExoP
MDDAPRYASLRDYLLLLRRRWMLIALPAVLGAAAAFAFSAATSKTYVAEAQILVQDETQQLTLLGTSVAPNSGTSISPVIVAQTVETPALARAVRRRLGGSVPAAELTGGISLSVNSTSGLLTVTATEGSARAAAAVANAYAAAISAKTTAGARARITRAARALQRRLSQLSPRLASNQGERSNLLDEISRLDFLRATSSAGQVAQRAIPPSAPSSPKTTRNAALGLLAGLLVGVILAFLRDGFDSRLKGSEAIADELGFPLIGQVRASSMGKAIQPRLIADRDTAGDVETFRILRNNLELLTNGAARPALVTSALPEEGKSTVATSVALAVAAAGRRTLLVEADLRRPSLARRLELEPSPGLMEYLQGRAGPEEILRSLPVRATDALDSSGEHPEQGTPLAQPLVVIPAGEPSGASTELLASERMRVLLDEVSDVYELVIVDSAPLLPVADTLQLLPMVGRVLLCARSGRATRQLAQAVRRALGPIDDGAVGVVVTDLHERDEPSMYQHYYSDAGATA